MTHAPTRPATRPATRLSPCAIARTVVALLAAGTAASACGGYTWVKKSDLESRTRIVVDSSQIMSLRARIDTLEARNRADSVRYAMAKPPIITGIPDSVLKARDAELAAVKDQLAKATAELDRIKRRLSTPRN